MIMTARRRIILRTGLALLGLVLLSACSRSVARLDEDDRSEPLVQRAAARRAEGKTDEAIALFREALDLDPGLARAHLDLAILLHEYEKDYVGAIYHYRRYLELRPGTAKRDLIENRIRVAGQLFGATVVRSANLSEGSIVALQKENMALREEVERLRAEVGRQKSGARSQESEVRIQESEVRIQKSGVSSARGTERPGTYRVQPGDTLSGIAREIYGSASKWELIYEANRDQLGVSTQVKSGQVLVIP